MRILLTGATGFIGSALTPELLAAGHAVVGLTRSDAGAAALASAGAEAVRADVNDLDRLREAASEADAVIHAAFSHDLSDVRGASEADRRVVETLGAALAGSGRRLVVTSGTGLVRATHGAPVRETDPHALSSEVPRAATEEAVDALLAQGADVVVVRLPQVHDRRRQGRLTWHVETARRRGRVAYVGDGADRLPAVHLSDAVRAYRLALERGERGMRCHAVAEEGVPMRDIAEAIALRLGLPAVSVTPGQIEEEFGPLAPLIGLDLAASGVATRRALGWEPAGPGLLADLAAMDLPAA